MSTRPRSASEFHLLSEELERLLAFGQSPLVAILLRTRFLSILQEIGVVAWQCYAPPHLDGLVSGVSSLPLYGVGTADLVGIAELLKVSQSMAVPAIMEGSAFRDQRDLALAVLTDEIGRRSGQTVGRLDSRDTPEDPDSSCARINIPVITHVHGVSDQTPAILASVSAGLVLQLFLELSLDDAKSSAPLIAIDGAMDVQARAAVDSAVRNSARVRLRSAPSLGECRFHLRWEPHGTRLRGTSMGLSVAIASVIARARESLELYQSSLPRGLAATGILDGVQVLPVRPETLARKVEACIGTSMKVLLVPKLQEEDARSHAHEVQQRTGDESAPKIIGVRTLSELFGDRRTIPRTRRPVRESLRASLRWGTRGKRRVTIPLIGILALVISTSVVTGLWRNDPVGARWESDDLVAWNQFGLPCMRVSKVYKPPLREPDDWGRILTVLDVDRDGHCEIISIHGSRPGSKDLLTVMSRSGNHLWDLHSTDVSAGNKEEGADLSWFEFYPLTPGPSGEVELLALRRSTQGAATVIDRLRARDGKRMGFMVNYGHLESAWCLDADYDGNNEIIFCGTSQETGQALFVFIDAGKVRTGIGDSSRVAPIDMRASKNLGDAVVAAWGFDLDRFAASAARATAIDVEVGPAPTIICTAESDGGTGAVQYHIDATNLSHPVLKAVRFTDGYRAHLRTRSGLTGTDLDSAIDQESRRLAASAQMLTAAGWIPMQPSGNPFPMRDAVDPTRVRMAQASIRGLGESTQREGN